MDNKTGGIAIIVCLTVLGTTALAMGINGVVLTGIVGTITAIGGSIFGISYGKKHP